MSPILPVGVEAAELLAAIHAEAFERPWSASDFAAVLAGPTGAALAAGTDGFILTQAFQDEAEVLTLAVRPAARRRGVARALVETAIARLAAAGVTRLHLEVAEDNAAARALYVAAGFAPSGRRRGYYARAGGPAVDALLLARALNTGDG